MSPCKGEPAGRYLEAYLQGKLPEASARRFEEHYFECPECAAQVEAMATVASQLGPRRLEPRKMAWNWLNPVFAAVALAMVIVAGLLGARWLARGAAHPDVRAGAEQPVDAGKANPRRVEIAPLADLSLLPFHAVILRGAEGEAAFDEGMRAYSKGDCAAAVAELEKVAAGSARAPMAHLYSGVCQLHLGRNADAALTLRLPAGGAEPALKEAALYTLAQAAIARDDAAAAQDFLHQVIAIHGDREAKARAQDLQLSVAMSKTIKSQ